MGRSCRFTYKNILFIDLVFYLLKVNSNLTMALTAGVNVVRVTKVDVLVTLNWVDFFIFMFIFRYYV